MKKLTGILVLLLIVYFFACDDAGIIEGEDGLEFSGTVVNWTSGGNVILKAVLMDTTNSNYIVLDTTKISSSGNFTLYLKTPAESMYFYVNPATITCPNNVTVTQNSRTTMNIVFELHNDSTRIGSIVRNNFDMPQTGYFSTNYEFANRTFTMSGTVTCPTDTVVFNFNPVAGLNKAVYIMDNFPATHYTFTNVEPSGGRWQALFNP